MKMFEFLVDNMFVVFAGKVFQQTVGIPICTNCARLLAEIFLCSYDAEFIVFTLKRKETVSISVQSHGQIDNVLSINSPEFENYLGQINMYPVEFEIKETTESIASASYLDLLLSIERDGQLIFTTNEMISIFTSQTFRSRVLILHLPRPIEFYLSVLTPRLDHHMNVVF